MQVMSSEKTSAMDYLGELFLVGFEGKELNSDTSAFLSQARIGGVILFAHNYESPEQIATLINQVQECRSGLPLWISTDHEGGRVQRFKEPFTIIPSAQTLFQHNTPRSIFEVSQIAAKELHAVGVNLNFAPVCDILTNPENTVIGDRAYAKTEDEVSRVVTAVVRGHITNGVQPCVKHFPGHGDTLLDSHDDLPRINTPLQTLRNREFRPFIRCFKSRCSMVMLAHILNPEVDPDHPSTFSSKWIQDILRKDIRYQKLIISDDMEMGAITKHYNEEEVPGKALRAGCDILIYRSEEKARKAYQSALKEIEEGTLSPSIILESAKRARDIKRDFFKDEYQDINPKQVREIVGCQEHQDIVNKLSNG